MGELLDNRYLVEHKLGFGGGSILWMAHDLETKQDVAVKVMSSGGWGDNETRMQGEIIIDHVRDRSHLVTSLASSTLPLAGYEHRALVFPLMGPCLCAPIVKRISMRTRMSADKQLLESLRKLHEAGIVHRDVNKRNCMQSKYEALGRPLKQVIPFVELERKGELVRPVKVPDTLRTEEFHLGDFGLAKKISSPSTPHGYPPLQYCSPERLHNHTPTPACDIWRLVPWPSDEPGGPMSGIVKCLGPLPADWKGSYTHPKGVESLYDPDLEYEPGCIAYRISYFVREKNIDPAELQLVIELMQSLLRDSTFRAIMERYGC
ncbi:kinase-like domain-containing protein [Aspergillus stella-maris]|uniref:kinase-like domain-containing protein n=1 Tax=Aspergillus stella-maris TaxID=1810926 RepID=UPI003CCE0402